LSSISKDFNRFWKKHRGEVGKQTGKTLNPRVRVSKHLSLDERSDRVDRKEGKKPLEMGGEVGGKNVVKGNSSTSVFSEVTASQYKALVG